MSVDIEPHLCVEDSRCGSCLSTDGDVLRPDDWRRRFDAVSHPVAGGATGIAVKDGSKFHHRWAWMNTRTKETFTVVAAGPMSVKADHPVGPMEKDDELVLIGKIAEDQPLPVELVPIPVTGAER